MHSTPPPSLAAPFGRREPGSARSATTLTLLAMLASLALAGAARAQSLQELYEAARVYDATYLAAKAQAQSAQYRADQSDALGRPSVNATAAATLSRVDPPNNNASTVTFVGGQAVPITVATGDAASSRVTQAR